MRVFCFILLIVTPFIYHYSHWWELILNSILRENSHDLFRGVCLIIRRRASNRDKSACVRVQIPFTYFAIKELMFESAKLGGHVVRARPSAEAIKSSEIWRNHGFWAKSWFLKAIYRHLGARTYALSCTGIDRKEKLDEFSSVLHCQSNFQANKFLIKVGPKFILSANFEGKFKFEGAKRIYFSQKKSWWACGARQTERANYKIR